jgi:hypothetical protein
MDQGILLKRLDDLNSGLVALECSACFGLAIRKGNRNNRYFYQIFDSGDILKDTIAIVSEVRSVIDALDGRGLDWGYNVSRMLLKNINNIDPLTFKHEISKIKWYDFGKRGRICRIFERVKTGDIHNYS